MIPENSYEYILTLDVNMHRVEVSNEIWFSAFEDNEEITARLRLIEERLGWNFNRDQLINFYRNDDISNPIKFLAAMIWGYEAPAGGRRAGYGPSRVKEMFKAIQITDQAINSVLVDNRNNIDSSYKKLNKKDILPKCGPNFFTKHFYFLGKSQNLDYCPVIFDDRVANSLFKLSMKPEAALVANMLSATTIRKPIAYLSFLDYIHEEARKIDCHPDQVEYYLFAFRN